MENKDNIKRTVPRFRELAKIINHYLKEEGLSLSFEGYTDTVSKYLRLNDSDLSEAFELVMECNLWSNYFVEVEGIIQLKMLEYITELDRLKSMFYKKIENKELDEQIEKITKRSKQFSLFYKHVGSQKGFFEKAHRHCYQIYNSGVNVLNFRSIA